MSYRRKKLQERPIGYEFLGTSLKTGAFEQKRPALVKPVTKVTEIQGVLAVPSVVAPQSDDPIEHLLFALKHEGINLQASVLALKHINERDIGQAFQKSPSSGYIRQIAYLWELANKKELADLGVSTGAYVQLFDADKFVTGPLFRNSRWRVDFNGIGPPTYCLTVRKTTELKNLLDANILQKTNEFIASLDKQVLDRAVMWAYLSETNGSYSIERESPSASKAEAFASLLARAHQREVLNEDYLVSLQNLAVNNPVDKAVQFRVQQNWLRNGLTGALGVTYFPPPEDHIVSIMNGVIELANGDDPIIDPLVRGALSSFGFVFAHPFMDGNGRLSRFLFHKVVCSCGKLPNGMVLPISIAMKRNEAQYLEALESFSKPARAQWKVLLVDEQSVDAQLIGDSDIYRYWDATHCVTFGLQMAQQALDRDLKQESKFLKRFDIVYKSVNESVDMNNNDLVVVVRSCLQNEGYLSNNRRKQLISKGHSVSLIDEIQDIIRSSLSDLT
jgi:hypothetical protein